ncbi:MAG: hypothetical protein RBR86_05435 [Pseudobdellovibrionaceae bacterium]|jgi:hypothetical protein|nr:hypothetical protein [Pseudobdellovibrionaceae bacterium]
MHVNIKEFVEQSGLNEPFYPGKRLVKPCPQPGEFRSHCVVYDWRDPAKIRVEIKAGLTGQDLAAKDLARYPVSFQAPSYIEIDVQTGDMKTVTQKLVANDDDEEDDEDGDGRTGKSGGGGKRPSRKLEEDVSHSRLSFSSAVEGAMPQIGKVVDMVIMGMKIAEEAYDSVMSRMTKQISHAKISATELVAAAGKLVTKFTPPAFLKPHGDENKVYKYNREKNEPMFTGMLPG